MKRYYYEDRSMPPTFRFPERYLTLALRDELPDLDPWWFLMKNKEAADFWLDTLREQYPNRSLVPFAKIAHTDDVACFDGMDSSGNPKVYYVHAFASSGWEDRGSVKDFETWLEEAQKDSTDHKLSLND